MRVPTGPQSQGTASASCNLGISVVYLLVYSHRVELDSQALAGLSYNRVKPFVHLQIGII